MLGAGEFGATQVIDTSRGPHAGGLGIWVRSLVAIGRTADAGSIARGRRVTGIAQSRAKGLTEDGQEDVDEEVGTAAALEEDT